jgi:trimethylamine:corrinoid methyltransferase-like protein
MKPIEQFVMLMTDEEREKMRRGALALLENPGMRIGGAGLRRALRHKGADVDEVTRIVSFPTQMIEEVLQMAVSEEKVRFEKCQGNTFAAEEVLTFNWHVGHMTCSPGYELAMGGGCPMYYDYPTRTARYASEVDLIRLLHLAEGIPAIKKCGNPTHFIIDKGGEEVPKEMMPLKTAAIVAKHSSKPGITALMSAWQLPYSVAMGEVIMHGPQAYRHHPIFINVNDTKPPLELTEVEGDIIEALARRGLPVFILPMPLMGIAEPVTVFSCAVAAVAEILGVWTCAKAVNPEAPLECAVVAGALEPSSAAACFSSPEAVGIDLAAAQFFRSLGLRCGIGVGLIDATVPGPGAIFERTLKSTLAALCGESTYVVGILAGGNTFSPEQMMLDLDIGASHHQFLGLFNPDDLDTAVLLLRERGIGGNFLDTEHTVQNFRERLWQPRIFERSKTKNCQAVSDPVARAYDEWNHIIARTEPYHLPEDQALEIDRILARAKREIQSRV